MTIMPGSENGSKYWKQLARKLTIDEHLLNSIEADYQVDIECCHQALLKWIERESAAAKVMKLLAAHSDLGLAAKLWSSPRESRRRGRRDWNHLGSSGTVRLC